MSKLKFKIGPAARCCLKKTSPYATLLLDVSSNLTSEDIASFKLAFQADKLAGRRQVCQLNHGADVLSFLDSRELISSTCTGFLEHLLIKIGRRDLEKKVRNYQEERLRRTLADDKENTGKKHMFTKIRELKSNSDQLQAEMKCLAIQTAVKEIYDSSERSGPEGASQCSSPCETITMPVCKETDQTMSSSPMSVDSSQENCTDEEKIGHLGDKVWLFDNDAIMSSQ